MSLNSAFISEREGGCRIGAKRREQRASGAKREDGRQPCEKARRAFEAGVTAYLLYNGSATYIQ